jgi:hypothetical protein
MKSLEEQIRPHTQYWDCYNDCPLKYNHTGKVVKIAETFAVDFLTWVSKMYFKRGNTFIKRRISNEQENEISDFNLLIILFQKECQINFNHNVE